MRHNRPDATGGIADICARLVRLSSPRHSCSQAVFLSRNRPGAGGTLGTLAAAGPAPGRHHAARRFRPPRHHQSHLFGNLHDTLARFRNPISAARAPDLLVLAVRPYLGTPNTRWRLVALAPLQGPRDHVAPVVPRPRPAPARELPRSRLEIDVTIVGVQWVGARARDLVGVRVDAMSHPCRSSFHYRSRALGALAITSNIAAQSSPRSGPR